ncbi:MAG: nitrous oxide-stimulated promoter family protein [Propionibacteriaceae bacterium]|jgi:hypothetical protein|nr:nitrous oxide-stimulated promoter family protein [Propionibacteriaceae bacterium]
MPFPEDTPELAAKRSREQATMRLMIGIYCKGHHLLPADADVEAEPEAQQKRKPSVRQRPLCLECEVLYNYSKRHIQFCRRMGVKTFCSACPVPCFKGTNGERIREVMRYSGPRMLLHDPVMAIHHLFVQLRKKRGHVEQVGIQRRQRAVPLQAANTELTSSESSKS